MQWNHHCHTGFDWRQLPQLLRLALRPLWLDTHLRFLLLLLLTPSTHRGITAYVEVPSINLIEVLWCHIGAMSVQHLYSLTRNTITLQNVL